ncbi:hypothetical protein GPECTOR_39g452 [Gonium pectorale]|uniref:CAF17 C-terminal domain-containing protein n=1 Tax=Gonium pectorale TaxID=33097 RepID=A0A150GAW1_GONPE|nr:hypothetical protein GPECTOR_39g452 [Gonium pectorale]|eukprot:KXZ46958.1 hypothetical protein GPECTOR_39g452 [Gonium pectorale]
MASGVDGGWRMALLASRGVLQAEGSQALGFLQGILSNDMRKLENAGPDQPPVYATILTPKGKFLHDVFVVPHPGSWWRRDPRLPDLGFRGLLPASDPAGESAQGLPGVGEDEYRALRYRLGVAEGETEIPAGQAAPLDYNVDVLNGVSYTKGCYVGQERNSFTHYRGVIRKRLMPVRLEPLERPEQGAGAAPPPPQPASLAPGTEVLDAASGRSVGQLRGAVADDQGGCVGIAYLKLDAALAAAEGRGRELIVSGAAPGREAQGDGEEGAGAPPSAASAWRVVPARPAWWPVEWGREEAGEAAGGA